MLLNPTRSAANDLWRVVLEAEIKSFHWTLMHRFHKASDIINEVRPRLMGGSAVSSPHPI